MKKLAKILALSAVLLCSIFLCFISCGKIQGENWDEKTLNWLKDNGVTSVSVIKTNSLKGLNSSIKLVEAKSIEEADYFEITVKGETPSEFGNLYIKDLVLSGQWALVDADTVVSEDGYYSYTLYSDGSKISGNAAKCVAYIYTEDNLLNEEPRVVLNFSVNQLLSGATAKERIDSFIKSLGFTKCFYGEENLSDVADWFMIDVDEENTLLVTAIDLGATVESSLLEIIDTQNFTIDKSSVDFHGTFVRGNEKNAGGNVATSRSFGNYGVYYMYINEDVPYYEWPSQTIIDTINVEGFETSIPDLDGLYTIEQSSDSIILRALDGNMHGYEGSLDKQYYNLLIKDAEKWTIKEIYTSVENLEDVPMYEACSTEVIDRECIHIIFGNIGQLKEFYFEIKTDKATGTFPSEIVAEFINDTWGFEETVVPTPEGDKWDFKDSADGVIALYTKTVDANSYYKYLINFSDSIWKVENGTRQTDGGRTANYATCISREEVKKDEVKYAIVVSFYQIELDQFNVEVTVKEAPGQFNSKAIKNIFNETFGFTAIVPAADGDSWQPNDYWCSEVEYFQYTEDFGSEDFAEYMDKFDTSLWSVNVIETVAYGFYQTIGRCVTKEAIKIGGQDMVMKVVTTFVEDLELNVDVYLINDKAEYDSESISTFIHDVWGFGEDVSVPSPDGNSWYYHEEDYNYYWQYTNDVTDDSLTNYLSEFDSDLWNITTSTDENGQDVADCVSKATATSADGVAYEIWVHILLTKGVSMDVTVNIQEHRILFPTYEINEKLIEQGWAESYRFNVNALNKLGAFFYGLTIETASDNETYIITFLSDENIAVSVDMLILDDYGGKPFTDQFEDRKYEAYGIIYYYPCYFNGDSNIDKTKPWVEIVYDPHIMLEDSLAATTITFTIPKAK